MLITGKEPKREETTNWRDSREHMETTAVSPTNRVLATILPNLETPREQDIPFSLGECGGRKLKGIFFS
jgi:hypothetical protein